jgi:phage baseplate assembly protein V
MSLGEHDRQIVNLLMWGVVAELDEDAKRVRVDADGMRTDWVPWPELNAGPGVRTWCPPEVGTQVIVGSPGGETGNAAVLAYFYQDDYDAPANNKNVHRVEYADGTSIQYDREAHAYTVSVGTGSVVVNCKTANVNAEEKVTITAPDTEITGNLKVGKKIEAGEDITTPADVKAGDIGLKTHKHPTAAVGSPSPPIP